MLFFAWSMLAAKCVDHFCCLSINRDRKTNGLSMNCKNQSISILLHRSLLAIDFLRQLVSLLLLLLRFCTSILWLLFLTAQTISFMFENLFIDSFMWNLLFNVFSSSSFSATYLKQFQYYAWCVSKLRNVVAIFFFLFKFNANIPIQHLFRFFSFLFHHQ